MSNFSFKQICLRSFQEIIEGHIFIYLRPPANGCFISHIIYQENLIVIKENKTLIQYIYICVEYINNFLPRSEYGDPQKFLRSPKHSLNLGKDGLSLPCSFASYASLLNRKVTKP